jgi:hypothetical protein
VIEMSLEIAENTDPHLVEKLIKDAKAGGMWVTYHPDPKPSNVVDFSVALEKRRMQMCQSAEA